MTALFFLSFFFFFLFLTVLPSVVRMSRHYLYTYNYWLILQLNYITWHNFFHLLFDGGLIPAEEVLAPETVANPDFRQVILIKRPMGGVVQTSVKKKSTTNPRTPLGTRTRIQ